MIKAKHHKVIYPLFRWLTGILLKQNFSSVHIEGDFTDTGRPVLVIANHISWWDGFWIEHLNLKMLHRRFYFMMLEEQLRKHWYFRYTGGYSVKPDSRETMESIAYTIDLLKKNDHLVLMFPQGKIHSSYNPSFCFAGGIQRVVNGCADDTQVLFVADFTDYFSDFKPHLYMFVKTFPAAAFRGNNMEEMYNRFYADAFNHHKTRTS